MRADIQIVDMIKDDEDRILLLKIVKDNEKITVGSIYDDNRNTTRVLTTLEELLDKIDAKQGVIVGGDYNVIVNPRLDQYGYVNQHQRTKAVKHHTDWDNTGTLIDIYRKKHKKGNAITIEKSSMGRIS